MAKQSRGRPANLSTAVPPAKWHEVVAFGVVLVREKAQRRANWLAYIYGLSAGDFVDIANNELCEIVDKSWPQIEQYSGWPNVLRHDNPTQDHVTRNRLSAVYPARHVDHMMQTPSIAQDDQPDISGLTDKERYTDNIRRHRNELKQYVKNFVCAHPESLRDLVQKELFDATMLRLELELRKLACSSNHSRTKIKAEFAQVDRAIRAIALKAAKRDR